MFVLRYLQNTRCCNHFDSSSNDETYNQNCFLSDIRQRFKCSVNAAEKCFATIVVQDTNRNCEYNEDENDENAHLCLIER